MRARTERVTVQFAPMGMETEVIVTRERIADELTRGRHFERMGGMSCWIGAPRFGPKSAN